MIKLIPLLALGAQYASAIALPEHSNPGVWPSNYEWPYTTTVSRVGPQGGKVPDVPGATPRRQEITTTSKAPGAKRVKIRSGPYQVPSMKVVSGPYGDHGTLWNYPDTNIERPCNGECTLLSQQAGLEYPNGTNANIDSGMWLHHQVGFVQGPTRWDPTCYGKPSGPHLAVMGVPSNTERLFASGNERTLIDYNPGPAGSGYHLNANDKFAYLVDLMNMNMDDRVVYVTMTYDYIEGPLPQGWSDVKSVWLDAFQCGTSELAPPKQTGSFTISSKPWTPNVEGKLLGAMGHVHDGGVLVTISASPGQTMCKQEVKYGESPAFKFTGTAMGNDKPAIDHISSMSDCKFDSVKEMKKTQSWVVDGLYDFDKAAGNIENGKQSNIMSIALILLAVPPGGVKPGSGWFGK